MFLLFSLSCNRILTISWFYISRKEDVLAYLKSKIPRLLVGRFVRMEEFLPATKKLKTNGMMMNKWSGKAYTRRYYEILPCGRRKTSFSKL